MVTKTGCRIIFLIIVFITGGELQLHSQNLEFINGKWYNGKEFKPETWYAVDGILSRSKPAHIDSSVNLNGGFVIPPFGEAHNHNLESSYQIDKTIDRYLSDGVFYVKLQSSIKKRIAGLMDKYNHPGGLEVRMPHAPITGTGGHPIPLRERYLQAGYLNGLFETIEEIEGHGYWIIDSRSELKKKWPGIKAKDPDFIKVMLQRSEEYELRKDDTTFYGDKGLNPKLLPPLVKMAHKDGYRVTAHVFTVEDFHHAVTANVDEIAHLPGYRAGGHISREDADLAAKNGTVIITTASLALKNKDSKDYGQLLDDIKTNLQLLKDAGVTMAIGSDTYADTSVGEVEFLRGLDVFTNKELLEMWCKNSAKTIFPDRKVGALKDGFEASFLVLEGNPLDDWSYTKKISLLVKDGRILQLSE